MAVAARPMEEPEHCLQVPPPRVCGMVPSGQHVYSEWKASEAPGSLLWVHGKRPLTPIPMPLPETENFRFRSGCRKERTLVRQTFHIPIWRTHRVGSSTIIGDIDVMRKAGLASLAFFYCDFREDQKKDLRGLLSWSNFVINPTRTLIFYPSLLRTRQWFASSQRRCTCRMFKGPTQTPWTCPRLLNRGRFG
jgi:hypothetical protein